MTTESLIYRLKKRAEIRRQITSRKSVQEGKPDRISDLLEEAASRLEECLDIVRHSSVHSHICFCFENDGCIGCKAEEFLEKVFDNNSQLT